MVVNKREREVGGGGGGILEIGFSFHCGCVQEREAGEILESWV